MLDLPYLIVGQGIAGTSLSFCFEQRAWPHRLLDQGLDQAASMQAAGLVNPITGRRFVKTWNFEPFQAYAQDFYQRFASARKLEASPWQPRQIAMLLTEIKQINEWETRNTQPDLQAYTLPSLDLAQIQPYFQRSILGMAHFGSAARVDLPLVLQTQAQYLESKNALLRQKFDHTALKQQGHYWSYQGDLYRAVIFAEGWQAGKTNPFFKDLPFRPAKGHILIVELEDYHIPENIICKIEGLFFLALGSGVYWIGSSFEQNFQSEGLEASKLAQMTTELSRLYRGNFRVLEARVGVRPAVKDRKPMMGRHPIYPNMYLFNGLGSKGSYLAPLLAEEFTAFLAHEAPLRPEVDLQRFL